MKKIRLYGCGCCGSEFTREEMEEARTDNDEGYTCEFCSNKEPLEDLGEHDLKDLYPLEDC